MNIDSSDLHVPTRCNSCTACGDTRGVGDTSVHAGSRVPSEPRRTGALGDVGGNKRTEGAEYRPQASPLRPRTISPLGSSIHAVSPARPVVPEEMNHD